MVKSYGQFLIGLIAGIFVGIFITRGYILQSNVSVKLESPDSIIIHASKPEITVTTSNPSVIGSGIPQKARELLVYIQAHHRVPSGYIGGRGFSNREKLLPIYDGNHVITYQEWDVNPKIPNRKRDAERIITGSDQRNWYSDDHYKSFKEIL
ncbi:MAG: ribonuclease domain-containing protein [Saprospiraceae bacterium]